MWNGLDMGRHLMLSLIISVMGIIFISQVLDQRLYPSKHKTFV